MNCLWVLDVATGEERLVADPRQVLAGADEGDLPAAERARRERMREAGGGIVAYDADPAAARRPWRRWPGGCSWSTWSAARAPRELPAAARRLRPPAVAHRATTSPTWPGGRSGWSTGGGGRRRAPIASWWRRRSRRVVGLGRLRRRRGDGPHAGHWWGPDGRRLAVARVDVGPCRAGTWPTRPTRRREPVVLRYPAAGTANARSPWPSSTCAAAWCRSRWDVEAFPYLASVRWDEPAASPSRCSRGTSAGRRCWWSTRSPAPPPSASSSHDPVWVDLVAGTPAWLGARLVTTVDDAPPTPAGWPSTARR